MAHATPPVNSGCIVLFGGLFAVFGFVFVGNALITPRPDPAQTRTQLLVSLAFVIIGLGLVVFGRSSNKAARRAQTLAAQNPTKPWLWRDDWALAYADPEWRSTAATWGGMGALCLLVSIPGLLAIPKSWNTKHRYELLVVLVFPLVGVYLLTKSAMAVLRDAKFRETRLTLSTLPGVIGGRVEGNLECALPFPPGTQVKLTLTCVRSYTSGSDGRSRWENALWQTQLAPAYSGGPGSSIPVAFTTPCDARETDGRRPDDEIFWKLTGSADIPGIDFRASFRVPVFKTEASDQSLTTEKLQEKSEVRLAGRPPVDAKITEAPSADGGVQFHFGRGRNKGTAAALTLFGLIFLGGGLFWGFLIGGAFTWFLGIVPLFLSGAVGLGLLSFAIWLWFGQTTIGVVNRSLRIHSTCLGFSRSRVVEAADIQRFDLYPGMRSDEKIWYDLKIHLDNGRTVTAGSAMEKAEAEWYLGELKKDLGMPRGGETA